MATRYRKEENKEALTGIWRGRGDEEEGRNVKVDLGKREKREGDDKVKRKE